MYLVSEFKLYATRAGHLLASLVLLGAVTFNSSAAEPTAIIDLWPGSPPDEPAAAALEAEADLTKPTDRLIAGRRIIKLGNVSKPQLHVYLPPSERRNGSMVVVCPGGGFTILAWDLEGTEVAAWLNAQGIAAAVLKYRVPTRTRENRWLAPVQDTQRALSLVRSRAAEWSLAPDRIGTLGFSAGGFTAAHVALQPTQRLYEGVDAADQVSFRPDFVVLVYPGSLVADDTRELKPELVPTKSTPPFFLVHAADDRVPSENSVQLFLALRRAGVPAELHVYQNGGHGYGLRPVADSPVTSWADRCEAWFIGQGLMPAKAR